MLWKLAIVVLGVWCTTYTLSYGIFEYKRKNPHGAAGVFVLSALVLFATLGIIF